MGGWKVFFGIGWLLAIMLSIWAIPRIYHRLVVRLPAYEKNNWDQALSQKKRELSLPWQDSRPLIIFAGDSEIEFGDWYDLFGGAWAVRNCGLARSKIADVSQLVSVIGQPRPRMAVLMCGVNNFGHGDSRDACVRDYEELLATVRAHLQPEFILVLSVMPVRETPVDRAAQQFNMNIVQFNTELAECCRRHQIQFLDVNPAVIGANGGLADELTEDGLHLNAEGYRRLARIISPQLAALMHSP